ncbi:MAG: H-NS family nucleoid-associated regulatory protein [Pseudomonadota bacterium]
MGNQLDAINLEAFSEADLNELEKRLTKERKRREKDKIKDAQKELRQVAEKYGMTPEEVLTGASGPRKGARAKVAPKYRHPDDESKTWTGRGRVPKWVQEWEQNGGNRDDLLIEKKS